MILIQTKHGGAVILDNMTSLAIETVRRGLGDETVALVARDHESNYSIASFSTPEAAQRAMKAIFEAIDDRHTTTHQVLSVEGFDA